MSYGVRFGEDQAIRWGPPHRDLIDLVQQARDEVDSSWDCKVLHGGDFDSIDRQEVTELVEWPVFMALCGFEPRVVREEDIKADLREAALRNNRRSPTVEEYAALMSPAAVAPSRIKNKFDGWNNAKKAAGLAPTGWPDRPDRIPARDGPRQVDLENQSDYTSDHPQCEVPGCRHNANNDQHIIDAHHIIPTWAFRFDVMAGELYDYNVFDGVNEGHDVDPIRGLQHPEHHASNIVAVCRYHHMVLEHRPVTGQVEMLDIQRPKVHPLLDY